MSSKDIAEAKNATNDRGTYLLANIVSELVDEVEQLKREISRLEKVVIDLDYDLHVNT